MQEVLQHYLQQGSKLVAKVLDCTKAFDLANFDIMFGRLLDCGMPAIIGMEIAISLSFSI